MEDIRNQGRVGSEGLDRAASGRFDTDRDAASRIDALEAHKGRDGVSLSPPPAPAPPPGFGWTAPAVGVQQSSPGGASPALVAEQLASGATDAEHAGGAQRTASSIMRAADAARGPAQAAPAADVLAFEAGIAESPCREAGTIKGQSVGVARQKGAVDVLAVRDAGGSGGCSRRGPETAAPTGKAVRGAEKGAMHPAAAVKSVAADALLDAAAESDELDAAADIVWKGRAAKSALTRFSGRFKSSHAAAKAVAKRKAVQKAAAASANAAKKAAGAQRAVRIGAQALRVGKSGGGLGALFAGGGGSIAIIVLSAVLALILVIALAAAAGSYLDSQQNTGALEGDESQIASFLLEKGLDKEHVAAIIGNFAVESGCNPRLVENNATTQALGLAGEHDNYPPELIDIDNVGYGIAQWSYHSRARALVDYAARSQKASGDIQVQCEFFWVEFSGSADAFKEIQGLEEATRWFHDAYERSADGEDGMRLRIDEASRVYTAMAQVADGNDTVSRAYGQIGKVIYTWGGCRPGFMDCSGFVSYCITGMYARIGTTETFLQWPRPDIPVPGDICVNSGHCGIYVGNGLMIDCGNSGVGQPRALDPGMIIVRYPG